MKIVMLGSGNVATHLAKTFKNAGHEVLQIFSNNIEHAQALANVLNCDYTNKADELNTEAEVYFFALKDDAVEDFLKKFNANGKLLVHTSGSLPMSVFKTYSNDFGVLYPLQSFNKNREVNLKDIPVFIEASNKTSKDVITTLANAVSKEVIDINSEQRMTLHTAAVFANNFTNHLYKIAADILRNSGLEFDVLKPLIKETVDKVMTNPPAEMQTGPAIRNDEQTIRKHLDLLKEFPEYKHIYEVLTDSIKKQSK